jgi:hypothetical protein
MFSIGGNISTAQDIVGFQVESGIMAVCREEWNIVVTNRMFIGGNISTAPDIVGVQVEIGILAVRRGEEWNIIVTKVVWEQTFLQEIISMFTMGLHILLPIGLLRKWLLDGCDRRHTFAFLDHPHKVLFMITHDLR